MRKTLTGILTLALTLGAVSGTNVAANAAPGSGTLTIVASGGSAENSGWTYDLGTGVLEVTSNSAVSIDSSAIVSKLNANLIVSANSIVISTDIISSTSSNLIFQSVGNIVADGAYDVVTQGGNITFQSNSTNSGSGSIRFGKKSDTTSGLIDSNGGNITFSGGTNLTTGFAMASSDFVTGKPAAGVAVYGYNVLGDGGSILVRGSSGANGARSTRAVYFEDNEATSPADQPKFQTNGAGTITVEGDGSSISHANAWGINFVTTSFITDTGYILLRGKGNPLAASNTRGIVSAGGTFQSTSGNISLEDTTQATADTEGTYFSAPNSFSTSGDVLITTGVFRNDSTVTFDTPSAVIEPYDGSSFVKDLSILSTITANDCLNLRIGEPGNTANITLSNAITVGGPLSIYGGNLTLTGAVSVPSSNVSLFSSGTVTQGAAITSVGLQLNGGGTFTLNNASNNVTTIAGGSSANRLGSVTYVDLSGGLTVGQIGSVSGLYASGVINISTTSGNLSLSQNVSSSSASGDSVLLYANKTAASGSAGDGNIILSGSATILTNSSARALLYSGVRGSSAGLLNLVGGDDSARSLVAASDSVGSISPSLASTGLFALFRTNTPAPIYSVGYNANQSTGGTVPATTSSAISQTVAANSGNLSRTGFTFSGWNSQSDGSGTSYAVGSSILPTADITLYAQWTSSPAPTPAPAATTPPAATLATTGASLEWLLVAGLLAVIAGSGFLAFSRRKRIW
jgi:uncharacterized repeat protein (TIGR02543 family)/LPXTG-motif cell wall-anchored protein